MILIALGSNLGDRMAHLKRACTALEAAGIRIVKHSAIREAAALLPENAPVDWDRPFLNQVVGAVTEQSPESLLVVLKSIETALGRIERGHWAPREIDLDLIACHDIIMDTPTLQLPHPRLQERLFVLEPLAEIAPGWRHPRLQKTVHELIAALRRPKLMAILNITPDSFSGDGRMNSTTAAVRFAELAEAGADIVDVGAESTRPGAAVVTAEEEWTRLVPVLKATTTHPARSRVKLSIDTRHAATAKAALALGVDIINDVSGLTDPAMIEVLGRHRCPVIVMHALTIPADPNVTLPDTCDPVEVILAWKSKVSTMGIAPSRLIYDPGIGFGKTAQQSWALVERAGELAASGGQWLFGHSRKSFLKLFTEAAPEGRDGLTLDFSRKLAAVGVQYLRVHDIAGHAAWLKRAA